MSHAALIAERMGHILRAKETPEADKQFHNFFGVGDDILQDVDEETSTFIVALNTVLTIHEYDDAQTQLDLLEASLPEVTKEDSVLPCTLAAWPRGKNLVRKAQELALKLKMTIESLDALMCLCLDLKTHVQSKAFMNMDASNEDKLMKIFYKLSDSYSKARSQEVPKKSPDSRDSVCEGGCQSVGAGSARRLERCAGSSGPSADHR